MFIASLAVVEEADKIRVVHDGSNKVLVNHRIRPKDQQRSPGAGELRTLLREKRAGGKVLWALVGDVAKAHRRTKIREEDWAFFGMQGRGGPHVGEMRGHLQGRIGGVLLGPRLRSVHCEA